MNFLGRWRGMTICNFVQGSPRDAKADLPSSKFGGHFNFRNLHSYHITFEEGLERMIGWTTLSIRSRSVAIQRSTPQTFLSDLAPFS